MERIFGKDLLGDLKGVRDLPCSGMAEGQAILEPPLMDTLLFRGPSSEEPPKKTVQMEPPLFRDLSSEIPQKKDIQMEPQLEGSFPWK